MLGTESYTVRIGIELGGTGISPPDSFSFRSSFRFRSNFRFRTRSRSSSSSTTSGDIFHCSGSRQLNHSSFSCCFCWCDPLLKAQGFIVSNPTEMKFGMIVLHASIDGVRFFYMTSHFQDGGHNVILRCRMPTLLLMYRAASAAGVAPG